MPEVKSNGITIYYERHGQGDPLLCIMGLGYDLWAWHRLLPLLAPRYEVITFDNRGAGKTDKPAGPYTVPMMAADTAGLLDGLKIRNARVLGVSLGGLIAQELAWSRPDLVAKLVLGGTMHGGPDVVAVTPEALALILKTDGDKAKLTSERVEHACAPSFAATHPELIEQLVDYRLREPVPLAQYQAQAQASIGMALLPAEEVSRRLATITAPTLILYGEYDRVVPTENAERLAAKIRGARVKMLSAVGHLFFFEDPPATAQAVLEFLA